jgi:D-aminoacyl-tRNA deacylase
MKLIVIAKGNIASANIGKLLKENHKEIPQSQYFEIKDDVLDLDKYERELQKKRPELIIVPSTHKSEAGVPMLNAHTTGNWTDDNSRGGEKRKLSIAPAPYIASAVRALRDKKEQLKLNYEVGLEVTHHSPTIDLPVMFIEVGSSEKQWNDLTACRVVADVVAKIVASEPEKLDVCVGFGGPHYAPQFTRRVLAGKYATGHICPKHHIDAIDESMILQAFEKTIPKPNVAVLEWKGLKPDQRAKIIEVLDKNKINWEKL